MKEMRHKQKTMTETCALAHTKAEKKREERGRERASCVP